MSGRTLGGGRIGSGRSLGPAPSASKPPLPVPDHVLSPTDSSASQDGSGSGHSTPPPSEPQDIASRISLENGHPTLPLVPPSGDRLACPICSEEMVTLLQLNRHLDDAHREIEDRQQDEVKDWFKQQMNKAKKFQPLAVLNQKLKGLDVFESNDEVARSSTPTPRRESHTPTQRARSVSPVPPPKAAPAPPDPDDVVTKQHWQRRSGNDICSDPICGKRLGGTANGIVNCRHCGKLFCDEHTMYQMKLSRSAQHEPVRGFWCRVCETCYKSRDGYNDKHGTERDRHEVFSRSRQDTVGKRSMEVSRLEKRLSRLTQLLANPPEELPQPNRRWSLAAWGQNDSKKLLEQTVVGWENDADVLRCPYCQQDFSQYTFRRHHCRTCGKVVCGDPTTGCSKVLGLNVATNFQDSLTSPAIATFNRAYDNLLEFERGIRLMLPRFQKLLQALQDPEAAPTSTQIADASRTRKRLMDAFTQYDTAARRIRDMPSISPTQLKLQKAIYQNASQFLHLHMLPLKALPKILKHATPNGDSRANSLAPPGPSPLQGGPRSQSALASIRYNHMRNDSSSNISLSSVTSSRISELEAEEKSLRERLIILEEQKFMVQEMVADANKRRKFDEVAALAGNIEDLSREIDGIQGMLDNMDFEGAYREAGTQRPGNGLGSGVASPARRESGLIMNQRQPEQAKDGGNG
ncbi:carboxypeptidase Y-deficient [Lithohypha guttulata]|uniref:carboxypeptidase Y-deficient n=1 Tax=Lithohypha guttulata TaxID=1690604 RepID=UPI002DDE955D|nr:carboxypeptidase Y-deficient [Lithohypha guttulata]